jgi:hypothetical protein
MLELQTYLSQRPGTDLVRQVGSPLELTVPAAEYQTQVRFVTPTEDASPTATVDAVPDAGGQLTARLPETLLSGFYEARLTKTNGNPDIRRYAVNVDPQEGDLRTMSGPELAERLLPEVRYQFEQAAGYEAKLGETAGSRLRDFLLYALVLLLIGEQVLAWSTSYHPSPTAAHATSGRWARTSPPLPLGATTGVVPGGEGSPLTDHGRPVAATSSSRTSPHPNPLPKGEGTGISPLSDNEGTAVRKGGAA